MSEETPIIHAHALPSTTGTDTPASEIVGETSHGQLATNKEQLSPDIQAFCALLARIVMRCLNQRDARVLTILSLSSRQGKTKQE